MDGENIMYRTGLLPIIMLLAMAGCSSSGGGGGDTESPVITITSHADGDILDTTYSVTLSGTATDNESVDSLTISINGAAATALNLSNGTFSIDLSFTSHSNEIVITATDTAGNSASSTLNLYYAATGLLDTTNFNSVGFNTFNATTSHDSGTGVLEAADGSYYVVGYANNGSNYDMALWHVLEDGTADTAFDGDGLAVLDDAAGGSNHDFGDDLAIDGDGKIVIVGHSRTAGGDYDLTVARFNSDGSLDSSFGADVNPVDGTPDGFITIDVSGSGSAEEGAGVAIGSDGSIYVAGNTDAAGDNDFTLWKFTSAGALDTSFAGGSGYLSYDSGIGTSDDKAKDIVMDNNGNLLVTGRAANAPDVGDLFIWRVTSSGVADTAFNGSGVVIETDAIEGTGINIDADGNILIAGFKVVSGNLADMTLWRYTDSGVLDTSFGGDYDINGTPDGYVTHDGAGLNNSQDYDYGFAVTVDAAGNILVAGSSYANHSGQIRLDMVVWRFTLDGVLDNRFGDDVNPVDGTPDGFFTHHGAAGDNNLDQAKAVIVDSLGRVVVVGESVGASNGSDMAIWRLY
jgi:uncharacterized delta-60 repeat protein